VAAKAVAGAISNNQTLTTWRPGRRSWRDRDRRRPKPEDKMMGRIRVMTIAAQEVHLKND